MVQKMVRKVELAALQPSELYLNQKEVREWLIAGFDKKELTARPLPAIIYAGQIVLIGDHPRAFFAGQLGISYTNITVYTEIDDLAVYKKKAALCREHEIFTVYDLAKQILSPEDYERGWTEKINQIHSRHSQS